MRGKKAKAIRRAASRFVAAKVHKPTDDDVAACVKEFKKIHKEGRLKI